MKILVYSVNTLMRIVNFGAELDLMASHLADGDEVFVLRCQEELQSCHTNPKHFSHKCYLCKKRFARGMALTGLPDDHLLTLSQEDVDYSCLPENFDNMAALASFTVDGINLGLPAIASMVMELKDHKFDISAQREKVNAKLRMAYLVHVNIRRLLSILQPDRVYVFNGRLAEARPVLDNCLKQGIHVNSIDRAGIRNHFGLFPNSTAINIQTRQAVYRNEWETGGSLAEKALIAETFFVPRKAGEERGDPSFTKLQKTGCLPEGFDTAQKNIGIYIMSEYEFAGDPERKNPIYADQTDGIVKIVESLLPDPQYKVWVRCHPNIKFSENLQLLEMRALESRAYPNLGIIWPADPVHTYTLMDHCDKVVTFGSTVGIEATFWGIPSILAGRAMYEDLEAVYRPRSHAELIELLLTDNLPPMDKTGALIYGYGLMTFGRPYRYFTQTSVYEGHWQDETFEPSLQERLISYILHKMDKQREKHRQVRPVSPTRS